MANTPLEKMAAGDAHYKAYVGPPLKYDLVGALQFILLTAAGLRDYHHLLDIGCGSLRGGKMLIPYLKKGHYCGLEPHRWLVDEGTEQELGSSILETKAPRFSYREDFSLEDFSQKFDFVLAQSIFSHSSAHQLQRCLQAVAQKLNDRGLFLATYIKGEEDYAGSEWVYPGCVYFRPQSLKEWARAAGLQAVFTNWPHPNGQSWVIFCRPADQAVAESVARFSLAAYSEPRPASPPGLLTRIFRKITR